MANRAIVPAEGELLEQILDASYEIWHEGLSRHAYGRYYAAQRATAWGRSHLARYALVEGAEVLASAKLYTFEARLDGRPLRVAGLGAVFTQPQHRGQGAAPDLIERLLASAKGDGYAVALLFSEIGAAYYERLGFVPIATADVALRVAEPPRRGAPMTMVRGGEERDLANVAAMSETRAAPFRFHLVRSRDLVDFAIRKRRLRAGLAPIGTRELQFFVAEEGGSAVAYAVVSVAGGEWTIDECGDRDPDGARFGALMQALVARDAREPPRAIRAWLPSGFMPPQLSVVDRYPSADVMMVRPLSPAGADAIRLQEPDILYWKSDHF